MFNPLVILTLHDPMTSSHTLANNILLVISKRTKHFSKVLY